MTMRSAIKPMMIRQQQARDHLIETLANCGPLSRADAEKVAALYLKKRLVKLDVGMGRSQVKHGALLDRDVIRRALALAT